MTLKLAVADSWPVLARHEKAAEWLQIWPDLGRAARTIDAYGRDLSEFLTVCERDGINPVAATKEDVAVFVRDLTERPHRRGANVVAIDSGAGLSNATIQQRLVPVRLFFDFLVEEGLRESNPVGRGRYVPGRQRGGARGLVPRHTKLPWIPDEQQWLDVLAIAAKELIRNRVMLALAYDAALRREELCSLRTDDLDPGRRLVRVRAETAKNHVRSLMRGAARSPSGGGLLPRPARSHRRPAARVIHLANGAGQHPTGCKEPGPNFPCPRPSATCGLPERGGRAEPPPATKLQVGPERSKHSVLVAPRLVKHKARCTVIRGLRWDSTKVPSFSAANGKGRQ